MISIKVPPLGESIVEATIARWLKKEGDVVAQNESLVELETDKITVEVPAFKAGVLTRQAKKEGDVVQVGEEIGEIDESAGAGAAVSAPAMATAAVAAAPAAVAPTAPAPVAATPVAPAPVASAPPKTSPAVRRIAADEGIDPSQVAGSAPGGRVTKGDMLATASATKAPPAPTLAPAPAAPRAPASSPPASQNGRETRERMTTRRRRIAEHLLESQHATAHLTTFNEVDMSAVSAVRDRLRERIEKEHGVKLTYMPFFAKAAALALKAYPA
ncbi:MAG: biotin/lipoyl-containing protein, partial [Gemmatimonadota bacterium]